MSDTPRRLPRAVIFDLDGTLVDSAIDIGASLNWLLAGLGRRTVDRSEVVMMVGDGVAKLVERGLEATGGLPSPAELADQVARFTEYYEAHSAEGTRAFPGAEAALDALAAAGCRLGICTNKPEGATREILTTLDLGGRFQAVAGGDTVPGFRKPAPEHLLHVVAALGVAPDDAVMVGDSPNDINAARNAGLRSVAVTFGYTRVPPHQLGADVVIDHFNDLVAALERL